MAKCGTKLAWTAPFGRIWPENGIPAQTGMIWTGFGPQNRPKPAKVAASNKIWIKKTWFYTIFDANAWGMYPYFFPRATSEGFSLSASSAGAGTFAPEKSVTHPTRIRPMENGNPLSVLAPRPPARTRARARASDQNTKHIQNVRNLYRIYKIYTKSMHHIYNLYIYNIHTIYIYIQYIYIQNIRDTNFEPIFETLFSGDVAHRRRE